MATAKAKDQMTLWNQVCVTDPAATKKVTVGRKFTTVCAQSQIKKATELWGAMGVYWGVQNESFTLIANDSVCMYRAELFYPDGKIEIHSDIEVFFHSGKRAGMYNEDFSKKGATDALTKGLSKLGFNADIFEGRFDDNKYVEAAAAYHQQLAAQPQQAQQQQEQQLQNEDVPVQTRTKYVNGEAFEIPYDPAPFGEYCLKILQLLPDAVMNVMRQIPQCGITPEQTIDTLTKDQEKYIETNQEFFRQQGCAAA
jgi:hypothetical protein